MSINVSLAEKLRRTALHEATNPHEAAVAAMKFCRMFAEANLRVAIVENESNIDCSSSKELSNSNYVHKMRLQLARVELQLSAERLAHFETKKNHAKLQAYVIDILDTQAKLKVENERLIKEAHERESSISSSDTGTDYVPFADAAAKAEKCFGRKHWKSAFAFELGMTLKTFQAWQTAGIFPAKYVLKLRDFSDEQLKPGSRQRWTDDEIERLSMMAASGATNLVIAQRLSQEFGRRLLESSIAGARRRMHQKSALNMKIAVYS